MVIRKFDQTHLEIFEVNTTKKKKKKEKKGCFLNKSITKKISIKKFKIVLRV